jgi:stage II sporulation protein M
MITMSREECRSYVSELRPQIKTSLLFFAIGMVAGLMIVLRFPQLTDQFGENIANFVKIFHGLPRFQLAAAIFFNNATKTLLAIVLGALFGVVPGIFLLANGLALGVVFTLATHAKGFWLTLLGILPHGIIELPAVFLGTSIGLLLGSHAVKWVRRHPEAALIVELKRGLRFFCSVIAPLLLVAAVVEAYITAALLSGF